MTTTALPVYRTWRSGTARHVAGEPCVRCGGLALTAGAPLRPGQPWRLGCRCCGREWDAEMVEVDR